MVDRLVPVRESRVIMRERNLKDLVEVPPSVLANLELKLDARVLVLCFVGPPGDGKTSLASSIAATLAKNLCPYPLVESG
ncbi:lon2, partial [Mucuna pruriens]